MRIVITDGFELNPGDLDWKDIHTLGDVAYFDSTPHQEIESRCQDADIIICNKTPIGESLMDNSGCLKLITVTATGYNNIDVDAAGKRNITVCNVPEYGTYSVAQHSFALLLELVNRVGLHAETVKLGRWEKSGRWSYTLKPITELKDKILGIVGFGKIGQQMAELGKAFGMSIIYHNRSTKISPIGRQVSIEELFRTSDVVSLHCPQTAENAGFVDARLLSSLKSSALLINTSRGKLINEQDLALALQQKVLAGAGLDVLAEEPPPPGHPLIGIENCIITPHNAWSSFEARSRVMQVTFENISNFLRGQPANVVSPK